MDIVQWLPGLTGLTGIAAIVAATITSRTAIETTSESNRIAVESANRTARVSLHTTYTTPRIEAVTDFLGAVENGRSDPTPESLTKTRTAYLTLRVLAFEETTEAKDVKARADALTENLRAMVDNLPHVPIAPAETMLKELESATRHAEEENQEQREAGTDMTSPNARNAIRHADNLRAALDLLREIKDRQDHRIGSYTDEEEGDLHGLGSDVGMPDLHMALETAWTRTERAEGRAKYAEARERMWKDCKDFAEAVARWLNAGPQ
ncbi:hypothetical protein OHB39_39595 [Streptomyces sp. NBC_00047]|uniref:hypothetical protein n=1 Tax=Streptomyces sp. NBC_00047 TaxID=2975627 RepID=UPI00225B3134|nr:hypothetical protein [Streptomyces sp. NBC_00047]MCX5613545.1 hypothetical protein [Streptomyces sp. NBC_00047]